MHQRQLVLLPTAATDVVLRPFLLSNAAFWRLVRAILKTAFISTYPYAHHSSGSLYVNRKIVFVLSQANNINKQTARTSGNLGTSQISCGNHKLI